MSVVIRQNICPQSKWNIKCTNSMIPELVVIHNTANDASANNEIAYMTRNNNWTSFHYAVDDVEIVQGLPLDRNGWHAGDGANGRGNRKGIGIEICYSKSGGARFDQAEKNAAWLTAKLLKDYGWGLDRVKKHQDFMDKYCPHRTLDYGWQRFLDMVKAELNEMNKPPVPAFAWQPMDNPRVMLAAKELRIYRLPSLEIIGNPIPAETEIDFDQKTSLNGKEYLRTRYSTSKNLNNGILLSELKEKPAPQPPQEPETPQVEPEPKPEQSAPETPPETPTEPTPKPTSLIAKLIDFLEAVIAWLKGKKD